MTVIAWDGRVLASDKRCVNNGLSCTVTKIKRIGNLLCGVSGNAGHTNDLFEWIANGRNPSDYPEYQKDDDKRSQLIVIDDGNVLIYETCANPIEIEDGYYATGSGRDYAMTAMYLGMNAIEAVRVASALDVFCGNGIDALEVTVNDESV